MRGFAERGVGERSDDGTGERADAAEQDHQKSFSRFVPADQLRVHEARVQTPHVAGGARQGSRNDEGRELVAVGIVAHRLHAMFVHTDALEDTAEQRAQQESQRNVHQRELDERNVIGGPCPPGPRQILRVEFHAERLQQGLCEISAVGAAAELGVVEDEEDHLPERQCHHEKEKTLCAQRQRADPKCCQAGDGHGGGEGLPDGAWAALRRQQVNHVGRESIERTVAETDKTSAADEQVQRQSQHGRDHRRCNQADVVGRDQDRQHREH